MTPPSYVPSAMSSTMYWGTQPYVILRYVRSMFLPLWLSADTDLNAFASLSDPRALAGALFCLALLFVAIGTIKRRELRPISFGILWFFFALAPTSVFVLSEVENDHRMFFPFVGLMLSVTWAIALGLRRLLERYPQRRAEMVRGVAAAAACLLAAYAYGTWQRNEVWHTEQSLWRDVTLKSPENGRGLMNYGLTLMEKGDAQNALVYFERAATFTPNYYFLEINTAIDLGQLHRSAEAEAHFQRAMQLAPNDGQPFFFYARWLKMQGRIAECIQAAQQAVFINPSYFEPRYLLMQVALEQQQWDSLHALALAALKQAPGDTQSQRYLNLYEHRGDQLKAAEQLAQSQPTADNYLNLSLRYHQAGRYADCIAAAQQALRLKPDYAEAYNNIAAGYQSLGQWDKAIEAAREAIRLKPDFDLAKNNLAFSLAQKNNQRK